MLSATQPSTDLPALRDFLHSHLLTNIIPFWHKHAIDPAGGLNSCIRDDGSLVSRDKWLWSQWRAVWVYSKLYNTIDRNERHLNLARHIYNFCIKHGWDDSVPGWRLRVGHDGAVQLGYDSIYVDAFAIYGLLEFAKATGEAEPLEWAIRTADAVLPRLSQPHDTIPHFPYPIPKGARVHGIPMIFCLIFWELGQHIGSDRYKSAALAMSNEIFAHFYRPDLDLILERISADNSLYPAPMGTTVIPGHVVEDMWFQIHILRDLGDSSKIAEACRLMRRHMEVGWDGDFGGGLLTAIDAHGSAEIGWKFPDAKLWWPHTEAMYGLLLAYEHTREDWCLAWYDKVHQFSFTHYPVPEHGEWTQRRGRDCRPIEDVVSLPVKDPFHLPRALIYCIDVLDRLIAEQNVDAAH